MEKPDPSRNCFGNPSLGGGQPADAQLTIGSFGPGLYPHCQGQRTIIFTDHPKACAEKLLEPSSYGHFRMVRLHVGRCGLCRIHIWMERTGERNRKCLEYLRSSRYYGGRDRDCDFVYIDKYFCGYCLWLVGSKNQHKVNNQPFNPNYTI